MTRAQNIQQIKETKTMTWFDKLYTEFEARHAAFFAFSDKQVADKFAEWGEPTPTFPLAGWVSVGAGLIVRNDVCQEFLHRVDSDQNDYTVTLPAITVERCGIDYWDRARYRIISADKDAPVSIGQIVVDVSLSEPGTAIEVHSITREGEPIHALPVRVVHADAGGWHQ